MREIRMAATDPTSHSCKDTSGPRHSLSEGRLLGVAFISYLWDARVLPPAQQQGRGKGTHSCPSPPDNRRFEEQYMHAHIQRSLLPRQMQSLSRLYHS